jgi:signal transduction histidine kinase
MPCRIAFPLHSLRVRLFGLWLLSLAAGIAVAMLLLQLYEQSANAQVTRAVAEIARACDLIGDRFAAVASEWPGPAPDAALRARLAGVVGAALAHRDGVEGGIWEAAAGPLAYAFPTYEGSGPKTDLPIAERSQIEAINRQAAQDGQPADRRTASRAQTLLLHACPLSGPIAGPIAGLTAWTMIRVNAAPGFRPLLLGLGVLFGLLVLMALWLGRTLLVWQRHVHGIETVLAAAGPHGMPEVPRTGERELDRIIDALNDAGRRLVTAQRAAETMAERAARAERLAGLGRVAAGVAHEIRNPIAAARLQGENGLAGDDIRRREAIGDMLGQLDRLDGLASELLAMTQRVSPRPVRIELAEFLSDCLARHCAVAAGRGVALRAGGASGAATLDPAVAGRVLDNLLTNAVRHAPDGGQVTVTVERDATSLAIVVEDSGAGVAPELTSRLFEPFVTGRPDGTGLGLAIARELADAHGGRLVLRRPGGAQPAQGAAFALELPCQPS